MKRNDFGRLAVFLGISFLLHLTLLGSWDFSSVREPHSPTKYLEILRYSPPEPVDPVTDESASHDVDAPVDPIAERMSVPTEEMRTEAGELDRAERDRAKSVALEPVEPDWTEPTETEDAKRTRDRILRNTGAVIRDLIDQDSWMSGSRREVFNKDFRKKLEAAQREASFRRRFAQDRGADSKPELLSRNHSYVVERIGGKCWRVPLDDGSRPHQSSMIMIDPDCPDENPERLDLSGRTGGHEELELHLRW